jgi:hypothetical protein
MAASSSTLAPGTSTVSTTSPGNSLVTTSRTETTEPSRGRLKVEVGGETIRDVDQTQTGTGKVNGTATRTMNCAGTPSDETCQPGEVCVAVTGGTVQPELSRGRDMQRQLRRRRLRPAMRRRRHLRPLLEEGGCTQASLIRRRGTHTHLRREGRLQEPIAWDDDAARLAGVAA